MAEPSKTPFLRRHLGKVIVISLILLLIAGFLAFRPAVGAFKGWRAQSLVEEAREYSEAGDWENVKRAATASLQNKDSVEALRLLVKAAMETDDDRSQILLYALFAHPEATVEERAMGLERALTFGDVESANRMVKTLSDEEKQNPKIHYQLVNLLLLNKDYQKAIRLADDSKITPRDPSLDLLLAERIAVSGLEGAREATTERLEKAVKGEDRQIALKALNIMRTLRDDWIYEPLAQAAINRFDGDPDLSVVNRLDLEFLKLGLRKVDPKEAVKRMIAEYREDHLLELVSWLKRLKAEKEIVEITDSDFARSNSDIFSDRILALQGLKLWEVMDEELKEPKVSIPQPLLFSAQALAAFRMGDEIKYLQRWEAAVDAAKRDVSRNWFYQLAETAAVFQNTDRQMEVMALAIEHPFGDPPASSLLSPLFQWLLDNNQTKRLLKITETLLRREPENPILINNYLYLKALHGKVNDEDVAKLRLLVKTYPDQKGLLDSLALVLLQNKEPQAAIDILKQISPEPSGLSTSEQAIYANALFALGREEEAYDMADGIRWKDLRQAELNLLAMARPE